MTSTVSFQHPHPNSTIMMPTNASADSYDQSARPTPFLIGGFAPSQSQLRPVSHVPPKVTLKLNDRPTEPVSFVFTPPSLNIPSSANAPDPVQVRPRSRSTHESTSPRAAVKSPRSPQQVTPVVVPEPKTRMASPLHADSGFLDFFSAAKVPAAQPKPTTVSSTATTATSTPVHIARTIQHESEDEEEEDNDEGSEDEEERRRAKKERKAARRAARAARHAEKEREREKAKKKASSEKVVNLTPAQAQILEQSATWLNEVDYYWVCHQSDMSTSTGFGLTKKHVTWRFVLDNRLHELELFHSKFSGKRRIRLDSVELVNEKVLFDGGSSHEIFIGEHLLEVLIFIEKSPLTFGYELMLQGQTFQRAKRQWITDTKQLLIGTKFDTEKGKAAGKGDKRAVKVEKQKQFDLEKDIIDDEEVSYATTLIKRKSSRGAHREHDDAY